MTLGMVHIYNETYHVAIITLVHSNCTLIWGKVYLEQNLLQWESKPIYITLKVHKSVRGVTYIKILKYIKIIIMKLHFFKNQ